MSSSHDVVNEILSQPEIWRKTMTLMKDRLATLKALSSVNHEGPVILTGCGSSYYLALAVAPLWSTEHTTAVRAISATDLLTYPESYLNGSVPGTLIAVSRSGKTREIIEVVRHARQDLGWHTVALTCYADTALTEISDETILLVEAAENARFTTRALTAKIIALYTWFALKYQKVELHAELAQLPDQLSRLLPRYGELVEEFAAKGKWQDYVFLGQGPYFGVASELMLKVKEIACVPAEAYSSLEYFHGPRYSATPSTLVVIFLSDGGYQYQEELLPRLKALGVQILIVCESAPPEMSAHADFTIELRSGLSDYGRLLLTMPLMQLFAYHRAMAAGKAGWIEQMIYSPVPLTHK